MISIKGLNVEYVNLKPFCLDLELFQKISHTQRYFFDPDIAMLVSDGSRN